MDADLRSSHSNPDVSAGVTIVMAGPAETTRRGTNHITRHSDLKDGGALTHAPHLFHRVIRCQFISSGKDDELTPDYLSVKGENDLT